MKTLTKGAFAMVLAGSVTFAVTNALLVDESPKRFREENALTVTGDQNEGDKITKAEKTVKDQKLKKNVKDNETKLSHGIPASKVTFKNRSQNDMAVDSMQQNTKKSSKRIATNQTSINETKTTTKTSTATTIRTTSIKAPTTTTASKPSGTNETSVPTTPAPTTKPVPTTKPATSTKAPAATSTSAPGTTNTTKTNRGQEVSQAAKEKGASNREKKENNGKNK